MPLIIALSPDGHLYIDPHTPADLTNISERTLRDWFTIEPALALLRLTALKPDPHTLSPTLLYWHRLGQQFIDTAREKITNNATNFLPIPYTPNEDDFANSAPPMLGGEYLNDDVYQSLWNKMNTELAYELRPFHNKLLDYLRHYSADWQKVGRVCFHLTENKNNPTHTHYLIHENNQSVQTSSERCTLHFNDRNPPHARDRVSDKRGNSEYVRSGSTQRPGSGAIPHTVKKTAW